MQRSDGGGVFDIVDKMNGHSLCGCSTVVACQVCLRFLPLPLVSEASDFFSLLVAVYLLFPN